MILTIDIGNTNIKTGLFDGAKLVNSWRMSTSKERTADEMGIMMESFFYHIGHKPREVEGIIVSSVSPSINYTVEHMCSLYFDLKPLFVGPGIKTGMNVRYDDPRALGADRICNSVASYRLFGGPQINVDFGTATTFNAVAANGDFIGGVICPGVKISASALVEQTPKLPKVELVKPKNILCKNSIQAMQAGIIYGYIGQVDYILRKLMEELGESSMRVVATGGMAKLIASESEYDIQISSTLTLQGLRMIYEMNA